MTDKYSELRRKYERLIYHGFTVQPGKLTFRFSIGEHNFMPEWTFDVPLTGNIDQFAFNLGMAELVSYWKCACPPLVEVRCGALDEWQIAWWKKLYRNGLGEFFYRNGIEAGDDFMQITATGKELPVPDVRELSGCLIPVGGGKDSAVTLELLNEQRDTNICYIIGDIQSAKNCAEAAGYNGERVINVSRTIDPVLLTLNRQGYLNGHTPFSSVVAFSSLLFAYMAGKKYIVLSNESSANEGNVAGNADVNHQYSKSVEFERDFREYNARLGMDYPEYFSLLRPLNEVQITKLFVQSPQYFGVFRSCNAGSKANVWCNRCAKCLYVYVMLSAWLDEEALTAIFGENLLIKPELAGMLEALRNPDRDKPFECVGTREEVNRSLDKQTDALLDYFDDNNFIPDDFMRLLI